MDERQRIISAGKGDQEAFAELVEAYQNMIYSLCYRMTGDADEAFDLAQETFLKAWHGISLFQFDSKFTTWLCRIASNVCIDYLRKQKKRKTESLNQLLAEDVSIERQIADFDADPAVILQRAAQQEAVREAFSRLSEKDRLILSLRAVEDMSYQEIGETLSISPGTVKSRIARARERIRRNFAGNFSEKYSSDFVKGGDGK